MYIMFCNSNTTNSITRKAVFGRLPENPEEGRAPKSEGLALLYIYSTPCKG
jgi:hypothetical protein